VRTGARRALRGVTPGRLELRAAVLEGGLVAGQRRDALRGLATLYDELYSHATDEEPLRAAAARAGCTHVAVVAGRAGDTGPLKVATVGAMDAALGATEWGGTRVTVSHGTHWYCRAGYGGCVGFARHQVETTGSPRTTPCSSAGGCRPGGGYSAGELRNLDHRDEWRKLMWCFHLF
jgi:hypothetical protein